MSAAGPEPHAAAVRKADAGVWTLTFQPKPFASLVLVCFPYAGGQATIFRGWPASLPNGIELQVVQLPGRGHRISEPAFSSVPELIEALGAALAPVLQRPHVFFGHSLGSLLAFELCRWRRRHGQTLPRQLIVSGRRAPQLPSDKPPISHTSHDEFVARLVELRGTPREVLDSPELLELLLPTLRADFALGERYRYVEEPPLPCPITVFGGVDDDESQAGRMEAWHAQTTGAFASHGLDGGHFFIHEQERHVLTLLSTELRRAMGGW